MGRGASRHTLWKGREASQHTLLKRFNKLLNDITSFCKENINNNITKKSKTDISLLTPTEVIIKLHNDKYKFTQTDIDKFLTNATYTIPNNYGGKCYLFCNSYQSSYYYMGKNTNRNQAINIMLNLQLSYDNVQLLMTQCKKYTYDTYNVLYKITRGGYIYSEDQIKNLIDDRHYKLIKLIYSVKFMSINVFKHCLKYCNVFEVKWIESMINKNKIVVTEDMLLDLLKIIPTNKFCIIQNKLIIQFLKKINKCTTVTIIKLLQSKYYDNVITSLFSISSKPDIKILIELCKIGPINKIIEYVELGIKPNLECLNHAIKLQYKKFTDKDTLYGHRDCLLKTGSFSVFRYMEKMKIVPDINTLLNICKSNKLSLFKKILKYGVSPTQECLMYAIKQERIELIVIILNNKILPPENIETFEIIMSCSSYDKILELIVSYGYELNLKMIEYMFKVDRIMPELDNLGIPYDEKLYYLCYSNISLHEPNLYHKSSKYTKYITEFKKEIGDIIHLRSLCIKSTSNLKSIKDYMINKNLKPDRYCIEYACQYNKELAKYFILNLKCTPTHKCIKYSSEFYNLEYADKNSIEQFINRLDKDVNYEYMAKKYDHIDLANLFI